MSSTKWVSKKVAILGSHAVGKTSLINRFIYNKFPENYLTTIGLKVDKKTVETEEYQLDMIIWDIAGQEDMAKVPHYYLNGCSGVIFVVDLTRPPSYQHIKSQLDSIRKIVGKEIDILVAGNKADLLSTAEIDFIVGQMEVAPDMVTSAKYGDNVEELFLILANKLITRESQKA